MAISRRQFLNSAGTTALAFGFARLGYGNNPSPDEWVIGTCRTGTDRYAVSAIDLHGQLQWQTALPSRGHDTVLSENQNLGVVIARRPERWVQLFSTTNGKTLQRINVPNNLKLNGHAVWHGDFVIVSAAEKTSSQMRLVIFQHSAQKNLLQLIAVLPFDYLGPHEIIKLGNALVVAIGGLKTDGREVLNKENIQSGVLTINLSTYKVEKFAPAPTRYVSLRHLASNINNEIFIAGQYQLAPNQSEPLLFKLTDLGYETFHVDPTFWAQLKGYVGSIICNGNNVIATSPKANWVGWFNEQTLEETEQILTPDVCALAVTTQGVIAGTGTGRCFYNGQMINTKVIWDNHFLSARAPI